MQLVEEEENQIAGDGEKEEETEVRIFLFIFSLSSVFFSGLAPQVVPRGMPGKFKTTILTSSKIH